MLQYKCICASISSLHETENFEHQKIIVLFPQISSLSEIYCVRMLIEFDIGMDIKCIMPLNLPAVKLITNYNHSLHGDSIPRWRC